MKYEEFLRSDPDEYSVHLGYYPFTNSCTFDGSECVRTKCPRTFYREKDKACLLFELQRIMYDVFGSDDYFYFDYDDEFVDWKVTVNTVDYHRSSGVLDIQMGQWCENRTLDGRICNELNMKHRWEILARFNNLHHVRKYMTEIHDRLDEIKATARKFYTCDVCKKPSMRVKVYPLEGKDDKVVCPECISGVVHGYFDDSV